VSSRVASESNGTAAPAGARALAGRWVVVTRAESTHGPLTKKLAARGADVRHWPVLRFAPPADPAPLERALARLGEYDWIVFSSPRAAAAVTGGGVRAPEDVRVAAVGASTAQSLTSDGWPVHLVPQEAGGENLVAAFADAGLGAGVRVLFPASAIARRTIPEGLRALGARVDEVVAYETVHAPLDAAECLADVAAGRADAVTFASPSAVEGLRKVLDQRFARLFRRVPAIAIGATTSEALARAGVPPAAVADPSTLDGLVEAVVTVLNVGSR
jgi:uroporphyrinogen-III synthase